MFTLDVSAQGMVSGERIGAITAVYSNTLVLDANVGAKVVGVLVHFLAVFALNTADHCA